MSKDGQCFFTHFCIWKGDSIKLIALGKELEGIDLIDAFLGIL